MRFGSRGRCLTRRRTCSSSWTSATPCAWPPCSAPTLWFLIASRTASFRTSSIALRIGSIALASGRPPTVKSPRAGSRTTSLWSSPRSRRGLRNQSFNGFERGVERGEDLPIRDDCGVRRKAEVDLHLIEVAPVMPELLGKPLRALSNAELTRSTSIWLRPLELP